MSRPLLALAGSECRLPRRRSPGPAVRRASASLRRAGRVADATGMQRSQLRSGQVLAAFGAGLIARPAAAGRLTGGVGLAALVVILGRILDHPGPDHLLHVAYGAWLGLAAAACMAVGGWWASLDAAGAPARPAPGELAFE